jgi:glycosyltransferase involved in cell wall biosynthesis
MIEGRDIICFSNDWHSDPLSKKHIMLRLGRRNRVLWVNSIGNRNPEASVRDFKRAALKLRQFAGGCRRVQDNIHVFSPLAIPFHGNCAARWVNARFVTWNLRHIIRKLGFNHPITWSFLPASADIAGNLGEELVIYHCVDEFSEFTGTDKREILEMERRLIEKADIQVVSSQPLFDAKRRYNPNTYLVTHGVDVEHFRRACDGSTPVPKEISRLRKPVIGFFGLIADWVDLSLLRQMAESRPEWSVVIIGNVATDTSPLHGLNNVHLFGRREYQDLPAYCRGMDVGILPFVVNELTQAANPLKIREYLAAGLPVVATDIPEVRRLDGQVEVAANPRDFLTRIDRLIALHRTGPKLSRSLSMDNESWDGKVEELSRIVCGLRRPHEDEPAEEPVSLISDI